MSDSDNVRPHPRERVVVFIDYGHLRVLQWRLRVGLHIQTLARQLAKPATLVDIYVYDCEGEHNGPLLEALARQPGVTVRRGEIRGDRQKGVDSLLAWDVAQYAFKPRDRVNCLILVSGDGDFAPIVRGARGEGFRVFVAHADPSLANKLTLSPTLESAATGTIKITNEMVRRCVLKRDEHLLPEPLCPLYLPPVTREVHPSDGKVKVKAGEVARVLPEASAIVAAGGVAIAEPSSSVHGLKDATIYFKEGATFTGTKDYKLIPVSERKVIEAATQNASSAEPSGKRQGEGKSKRKRDSRRGRDDKRRRHSDKGSAEAGVDGGNTVRRIPIRRGDAPAGEPIRIDGGGHVDEVTHTDEKPSAFDLAATRPSHPDFIGAALPGGEDDLHSPADEAAVVEADVEPQVVASAPPPPARSPQGLFSAEELKEELKITGIEAEALAKMRRGLKMGVAAKIIPFLQNPRAYRRDDVEKLIAACGDEFEIIKNLLRDSMKVCEDDPLEV